MNQDDMYKPTEVYDPSRHRHGEQLPAQPGWQPAPAWGNRPGGQETRTEVLRPRGPNVFAFLVMVEGPAKGRVFPLDPSTPTTIGRDYSCDIPLDEPAVSRQHVRIKLDDNRENGLRFFIQDLATENGTLLNGKEVVKEYLKDNDRITLGRVVLVFKQVEKHVPGTNG